MLPRFHDVEQTCTGRSGDSGQTGGESRRREHGTHTGIDPGRDKMLGPVELLVVLGICFLSRFLLQWWKGLGKKKPRYPPSLPALPIVGSLPFLRGFKSLPEFFMRKADQLGPIFTFRAGSKLVLILNSKKVIEDALVNNISTFSGRSSLYSETISNPNTKGMGQMNTTKEWKRYRQLSLSILKQFGFGVKSIMESRILTELEYITEFMRKQNGRSFNPREIVYLATTNVITNIVFGRRNDYDFGLTELVHQIKRLFDTFDGDLDVAPILRFLPFHRDKLNQHIAADKALQQIFRNEIAMILEDPTNDCFVSRYLEHDGPTYDAEQLGFLLRDVVGGGTDTTANTLLWTMVALANNPGVQDRLRAEIDAVIPRDRLPYMTDQPNLPFVDATSLEMMRWRTLAPLAMPHMTTSDTTVGDYFVPSGTTVLINLYAAHNDPKVWKDPETFRPERFLDKDGQVINKESVIAFSMGRRSCFGESLARAEFFLLLTGLVQRFIVQPPEGQTIVEAYPIEPVALILTSSEFDIRLIPRD